MAAKRHGLRLVAGEADLPDGLSELAQTRIPEADGVTAVASSPVIDQPWPWFQAEELAGEQAELYGAAGLAGSRPAEVRAAGSLVEARVAEQQTADVGTLVEAARRYAAQARAALSPFVQRPPDAKPWYLARMVALFIGDVAAVTGACVLLGEIPALALMLALSTGASAVIGGLAGGEAKRVRLTRERQTSGGDTGDGLPEALRPWRHLFGGAGAGRGVVRLMARVSGLIVLCLATGVVALRWGLDGLLSGLSFGAFAVAVSLASLWNSYAYADDIADMLDAADKAYAKLARQQAALAGQAGLRSYYQAAAEAASVQAERAAQGLAAGHRIRAAKFAVLTRHPGIAGHGPRSRQAA